MYDIRKSLHGYARIYSFLVYLYHIGQDFLVRKYFFEPELELSSVVVKVTTLFIAMSLFMFSKDKHHDEIKSSEFNTNVIATFIRFIDVYNHYNKLNKNHLETAMEIITTADINMNLLFWYIFVDVAICSGCHMATQAVLLIHTQDTKYIKQTFKRLLYFSTIVVAYFFVFSPVFGDYIFEFVFSNISAPNNVILYNMIPQDKGVRQRLLMHSALYIFS